MAPKYREVKSNQIPKIELENGTTVRIISGNVGGRRGPVTDIVIEPEYLDVFVPAQSEFTLPTKAGHTAFSYIIEGKGFFCREKKPFGYEVQGANYFDMKRNPLLENGNLVLFEDGGEIEVITEQEPIRFLLMSGRPTGEPVAWYGPIVMNTQEELRIAFEEYNEGTFLKHGT